MNNEIPLWLAIIVVAFLFWGCGLTLIGSIGLIRFSSFYDRLHMPTLGTTWGIGGVLIASMFHSSFQAGSLVLHELLITIFLVITVPVTLMMLSRSAALRDNTNDWSQLSDELFPERSNKKQDSKVFKISRSTEKIDAM